MAFPDIAHHFLFGSHLHGLPTGRKKGFMASPFTGPISLILVALGLLGCAASGSESTGKNAGPNPTIWKFDDTKSIGGISPVEVLGSPKVQPLSSGTGMQFNGTSDGLIIPANPIKGFSQFTIEVHFKPDSGGPEEQRFLHIQDEQTNRALMETRLTSAGWALDTFLYTPQSQLPLLDRTKLHPPDRWTWVALVYDNGTMTSYVDGQQELQGQVAFVPMVDGKISLGVRQNKVSWFKGVIGEVRFHPAAITPAALQRNTGK
jgi:hypothetical protein